MYVANYVLNSCSKTLWKYEILFWRRISDSIQMIIYLILKTLFERNSVLNWFCCSVIDWAQHNITSLSSFDLYYANLRPMKAILHSESLVFSEELFRFSNIKSKILTMYLARLFLMKNSKETTDFLLICIFYCFRSCKERSERSLCVIHFWNILHRY